MFFPQAGCTEAVAGVAIALSDPSSTGEVRVNYDGSVSVDPGYLSNKGKVGSSVPR